MIADTNSRRLVEIVTKYPNVGESATTIAEAVRNCEKNIIANAQVKSGKRIIIQVLSWVLQKYNEKQVVHYHITKLFRLDSNEQITEQNSFPNLTAFAINGYGDIFAIFSKIDIDLYNGKYVVINIDESDYGSGNKQVLSQIHKKYYNNPNVRFIYWSATSQELIYSNMINNGEAQLINIIPGAEYRGAKWFLDNNLVTEAEPFWNTSKKVDGKSFEYPSVQAVEALDELMEAKDKFFGIIRFNGSGRCKGGYKYFKANGELEKFLNAKGFEVRWIDSENAFNWGNTVNRSWENFVNDCKKVILIINQTSTRSTEWGFHKYIQFYHDYRPATVALTTMIQAFGRVFHYDPNGFPIKLFCNVKAIQVASNQLSEAEYHSMSTKKRGDISTRIDSRPNPNNPKEEATAYYFSTKLDASIGINVILARNNEPKCESLITSTCSQWNENDLAAIALQNLQTGFEKKRSIHRIYLMDSANPNFTESWAKLESSHPEWVGKYVYVYIKTPSNAQLLLDELFTRTHGRNSSMY